MLLFIFPNPFGIGKDFVKHAAQKKNAASMNGIIMFLADAFFTACLMKSALTNKNINLPPNESIWHVHVVHEFSFLIFVGIGLTNRFSVCNWSI